MQVLAPANVPSPELRSWSSFATPTCASSTVQQSDIITQHAIRLIVRVVLRHIRLSQEQQHITTVRSESGSHAEVEKWARGGNFG